ncbi:MAG: class I SAM-dependent methyltransferase family protein [Chloroflexota bacterium]|nr:class I SAM-dependent methyltransferase family protein [Chloroflexota bacterium]
MQERLRGAIDARPGALRLISMCAGEGRDVAGVLRDHPRRGEISVRLVELDPRNAEVARAAVAAAGLERVEVVEADAAETDSYAGAVPAEIILACGVFGNISDEDVRHTIERLPCFAADGATVIWTRGRERERDAALVIREWFVASGFVEVAFDAPDDARFRVGVHRLVVAPRPFERGMRLFRFLR